MLDAIIACRGLKHLIISLELSGRIYKILYGPAAQKEEYLKERLLEIRDLPIFPRVKGLETFELRLKMYSQVVGTPIVWRSSRDLRLPIPTCTRTKPLLENPTEWN